MSSEIDSKRPDNGSDFLSDVRTVWYAIPYRIPLFVLLLAWVVVFHKFGSSTHGYGRTESIFGWWRLNMAHTTDEEHAWLIPFVVVALLWWRRGEFLKLEKKPWWPALFVLMAGVLLHLIGYISQQPRISVVGFFVGCYALTGLLLGRQWMGLALFPFSLFVFCVPLGVNGVEAVSFPLRLIATKITAVFCDTLLGIKVVQNGTQLFDAAGSYQYEVAAACSGIRSLTMIAAMSVIYGYITFKSTWRRLFVAISAIPLAVLANVFRLCAIVLAAEAFGQSAGNYVHDNAVFSLLPYVPAFGGLFLIGWWLSEDRKPSNKSQAIGIVRAEQKL